MSGINRHLSPTNASSTVNLNPPDILKEYCHLASRQHLSDPEAERLVEILTLAESDGHLDFWINEADHFLAHELNLVSDEVIYTYENQQAKLREYLSSSEKLQQSLKNQGFDPGPIDGIIGPRTQSAILNFQRAHQLNASGIPDAVTWMALLLKSTSIGC